jgi:hypothetical protein
MQPLTVDANRPKGRFCIMGNEKGHAWAGGSLAPEKSHAYRDVLLRARSVLRWPCPLSEQGTPIGPLWTGQSQGNSAINRTTVDRFPLPALRDASPPRQHWYRAIPMLLPTSCILSPVLAHWTQGQVGVNPKGNEIPDLTT